MLKRNKIYIFNILKYFWIVLLYSLFIECSTQSFTSFKFFELEGAYRHNLGEVQKKGTMIFSNKEYNINTVINYSDEFDKFHINFPENEYYFERSLLYKNLWNINLNGNKVGEIKSEFSSINCFNCNMNINNKKYLFDFNLFTGKLSINNNGNFRIIDVECRNKRFIVPRITISEAIAIVLGLIPCF